jgi:hypothetical protein
MKLSSCLLGVLVATHVLADAPANAPAAGSAAGSDVGVWQKHQYSFAYMGFTSTYSCDGLAAKLKTLLLAAGARPDVKARAGACASGFGRPDKFARADLTFYTLAPAGFSMPTDGAATGTWRAVTFEARKPRELSTGDCELVEQFRTNVLPMFTTRNVVSGSTCIPHELSGSTVDLKFEAFSAIPGPPATAAVRPR